MGCDDRPKGEACNCCGDSELRELIRQLTERIHENETKIKELSERKVVFPDYTDCSGLAISNNAVLATCSDLRNAINGIRIPDLPNIPDISGLIGRINHLQTEIDRLTQLISNLQSQGNGPGRDNNFGGRVDQATIDGLISQIQDIVNRFPDLSRRIRALEDCCEEVRQKLTEQQSQGGECDYNGWTVDVISRFIQHNDPDYGRRFDAIISGPKLKSVTVVPNKGPQQTIVTGDSGSAQISWEEKPQLGGGYSGIVRLVHCGREVSRTNVLHV